MSTSTLSLVQQIRATVLPTRVASGRERTICADSPAATASFGHIRTVPATFCDRRLPSREEAAVVPAPLRAAFIRWAWVSIQGTQRRLFDASSRSMINRIEERTARACACAYRCRHQRRLEKCATRMNRRKEVSCFAGSHIPMLQKSCTPTSDVALSSSSTSRPRGEKVHGVLRDWRQHVIAHRWRWIPTPGTLSSSLRVPSGGFPLMQGALADAAGCLSELRNIEAHRLARSVDTAIGVPKEFPAAAEFLT